MSVITGGNIIGGGPAPTYAAPGAPVDGTDEVQRLTIGGTPEAGSKFRLTYDGWTTEPIAWSATDATLVANVQAALDAIAPLDDGEVTVAEVSLTSGVGTISITFDGPNLSKRNVPLAVASEFLKSDGTASTGTAAVTLTTAGVDATFRDAGTGAKYLDSTAGIEYVNTGSAGAPTWSAVETGAVSPEVAALAAAIPTAAVADIAGANMTAITPHTATTAIAATYADLPAARTSVDALRTDVEAAFDEIDATLTDLRGDAEGRLDDIETKLNALLAELRTAGIVTP